MASPLSRMDAIALASTAAADCVARPFHRKPTLAASTSAATDRVTIEEERLWAVADNRMDPPLDVVMGTEAGIVSR